MKAIYEAPFVCDTASAFPKVSIPTSSFTEPVYDFENNRAAFDLQPLVNEGLRRVHNAIEYGVVEILREAYIAGAEMAYGDTCGCISEPGDRDFEDWLEAKRQEIRCSNSL